MIINFIKSITDKEDFIANYNKYFENFQTTYLNRYPEIINKVEIDEQIKDFINDYKDTKSTYELTVPWYRMVYVNVYVLLEIAYLNGTLPKYTNVPTVVIKLSMENAIKFARI